MFGTRDLFDRSEKINEIANSCLESCLEKLSYLTIEDTTRSNAERKQECKNFLVNTLQETSQIFYLRRLYQQGKQISQIIAYIWRWADNDEETPQKKIAKKLKIYFTNPTEDNEKPGGKLKELLKADPRKPEENLVEEDRLLKAVFFEDNCSKNQNSKDNLLFPMFDEFELGDKFPDFGYLFQVNLNSFQGTIDDPTKNAPELMKFNIPYPPCPKFGEATVTSDELDKWIKNREANKFFADNPYIPTTCS